MAAVEMQSGANFADDDRNISRQQKSQFNFYNDDDDDDDEDYESNGIIGGMVGAGVGSGDPYYGYSSFDGGVYSVHTGHYVGGPRYNQLRAQALYMWACFCSPKVRVLFSAGSIALCMLPYVLASVAAGMDGGRQHEVNSLGSRGTLYAVLHMGSVPDGETLTPTISKAQRVWFIASVASCIAVSLPTLYDALADIVQLKQVRHYLSAGSSSNSGYVALNSDPSADESIVAEDSNLYANSGGVGSAAVPFPDLFERFCIVLSTLGLGLVFFSCYHHSTLPVLFICCYWAQNIVRCVSVASVMHTYAPSVYSRSVTGGLVLWSVVPCVMLALAAPYHNPDQGGGTVRAVVILGEVLLAGLYAAHAYLAVVWSRSILTRYIDNTVMVAAANGSQNRFNAPSSQPTGCCNSMTICLCGCCCGWGCCAPVLWWYRSLQQKLKIVQSLTLEEVVAAIYVYVFLLFAVLQLSELLSMDIDASVTFRGQRYSHNNSTMWFHARLHYLSIYFFASAVYAVLIGVLPARIARHRSQKIKVDIDMKHSYIKHISHEMLSPLNIVSTGLQAIVAEEAEAEASQLRQSEDDTDAAEGVEVAPAEGNGSRKRQLAGAKGATASNPASKGVSPSTSAAALSNISTIKNTIARLVLPQVQNETTELHQSLLTACDEMTRVLKGLLDDTAQLAMVNDVVDVATFLQSSFYPATAMCREKRITCNVLKGGCLEALRGKVCRVDRGKMTQVLRDIAHNAVKFTPSGGSVNITASIVHQGGGNRWGDTSLSYRGDELYGGGNSARSAESRSARSGSSRGSSPRSAAAAGGASENGFVVIKITDTGVGISKEHIGRVFNQPLKIVDNQILPQFEGGKGHGKKKKKARRPGYRRGSHSEFSKFSPENSAVNSYSSAHSSEGLLGGGSLTPSEASAGTTPVKNLVVNDLENASAVTSTKSSGGSSVAVPGEASVAAASSGAGWNLWRSGKEAPVQPNSNSITSPGKGRTSPGGALSRGAGGGENSGSYTPGSALLQGLKIGSGSGMALTVVKSIVQLHNGTVSVESAGLNQGCTFTVKLPLTNPSVLQQETPLSPSSVTGEKSSSRTQGGGVFFGGGNNSNSGSLPPLPSSTATSGIGFGGPHPSPAVQYAQHSGRGGAWGRGSGKGGGGLQISPAAAVASAAASGSDHRSSAHGSSNNSHSGYSIGSAGGLGPLNVSPMYPAGRMPNSNSWRSAGQGGATPDQRSIVLSGPTSGTNAEQSAEWAKQQQQLTLGVLGRTPSGSFVAGTPQAQFAQAAMMQAQNNYTVPGSRDRSGSSSSSNGSSSSGGVHGLLSSMFGFFFPGSKKVGNDGGTSSQNNSLQGFGLGSQANRNVWASSSASSENSVALRGDSNQVSFSEKEFIGSGQVMAGMRGGRGALPPAAQGGYKSLDPLDNYGFDVSNLGGGVGAGAPTGSPMPGGGGGGWGGGRAYPGASMDSQFGGGAMRGYAGASMDMGFMAGMGSGGRMAHPGVSMESGYAMGAMGGAGRPYAGASMEMGPMGGGRQYAGASLEAGYAMGAMVPAATGSRASRQLASASMDGQYGGGAMGGGRQYAGASMDMGFVGTMGSGNRAPGASMDASYAGGAMGRALPPGASMDATLHGDPSSQSRPYPGASTDGNYAGGGSTARFLAAVSNRLASAVGGASKSVVSPTVGGGASGAAYASGDDGGGGVPGGVASMTGSIAVPQDAYGTAGAAGASAAAAPGYSFPIDPVALMARIQKLATTAGSGAWGGGGSGTASIGSAGRVGGPHRSGDTTDSGGVSEVAPPMGGIISGLGSGTNSFHGGTNSAHRAGRAVSLTPPRKPSVGSEGSSMTPKQQRQLQQLEASLQQALQMQQLQQGQGQGQGQWIGQNPGHSGSGKSQLGIIQSSSPGQLGSGNVGGTPVVEEDMSYRSMNDAAMATAGSGTNSPSRDPRGRPDRVRSLGGSATNLTMLAESPMGGNSPVATPPVSYHASGAGGGGGGGPSRDGQASGAEVGRRMSVLKAIDESDAGGEAGDHGPSHVTNAMEFGRRKQGKNQTSNLVNSSSDTAAGSTAAQAERIPHVLIVDDSGMNRKVIARLVKLLGYTSEEAEDGVEALELVKKSMNPQKYAQANVQQQQQQQQQQQSGAATASAPKSKAKGGKAAAQNAAAAAAAAAAASPTTPTLPKPFDIILLDNFMPRMTGWEAAYELRHTLRYRGVIIGVTGNVLPADVEEFQSSGAQRILGKPINMGVLKATILECTEELPTTLAAIEKEIGGVEVWAAGAGGRGNSGRGLGLGLGLGTVQLPDSFKGGYV